VAGVPGRGGKRRLRAGGAHGGDEGRLRQRRQPDRRAAAHLQQGAAGGDHPGDFRDRRRRRRRLTATYRRGAPRARETREHSIEVRRTMSSGNIVEIIGAVVDVRFAREAVPKVYDALNVSDTGLTLEVQQQMGDGIVRTIAMGSSDGLRRGLEVTNTGGPISVPVGAKTLGRIMNVLGEPIDELGPVESEDRHPIHRKPPAYADQAASVEILETGIKVIDLIMPIAKGGKIGLFGGAGVGKTVTLMELINNIAVQQEGL